MPQVLKVFGVCIFAFSRKCPHLQDKSGFVVLFVLIAVLDGKELSAAGERIRHSLDLTEVLQDLN